MGGGAGEKDMKIMCSHLGPGLQCLASVNPGDLGLQVALLYMIREPKKHPLTPWGDYSRFLGLSPEVLGGNVFGIPTKVLSVKNEATR